jgi:CheY-like chemotaxis protein
MRPDGKSRSRMQELAHELRDALSPLAAAADFARLRGFEAEASRLLADHVDRGLRRARAILDACSLAEPREGAEKTETSSLDKPPLPHRAAGLAGDGGRNRVLIVDDSAHVRRSYHEALGALGYTVTEAADAEQALSALASSAPDVALIDIHLPRMSGFQLARAIRGQAGGSIFLVMLTGVTLDATTRKLAREAGFDESLDKMAGPVALRELLASRGVP